MYGTHQYVLGLAAAGGATRLDLDLSLVRSLLSAAQGNLGDIIEVCPCLRRDNCACLFDRHASRYLGWFHYMEVIGTFFSKVSGWKDTGRVQYIVRGHYLEWDI